MSFCCPLLKFVLCWQLDLCSHVPISQAPFHHRRSQKFYQELHNVRENLLKLTIAACSQAIEEAQAEAAKSAAEVKRLREELTQARSSQSQQ